MKGESGALVNKLDLLLFAVENIEHKMKSFQFLILCEIFLLSELFLMVMDSLNLFDGKYYAFVLP
jgi:hypothetical protein